MQLFLMGYPGDLGGACTEAWHTLKIWRRLGLAVQVLPTWSADAKWRTRLDALGCSTHEASAETLEHVPGLAGATVVSFCNSAFLAHAQRLRELRRDVRRRERSHPAADALRMPAGADRRPEAEEHREEDREVDDDAGGAVFGEDALGGLSHVILRSEATRDPLSPSER